jgi:hypothetical protein
MAWLHCLHCMQVTVMHLSILCHSLEILTPPSFADSHLITPPIFRCFVTKSSYTGNEDFTGADGIFDCIGEKGDERFSLADLTKAVEAAASKAPVSA